MSSYCGPQERLIPLGPRQLDDKLGGGIPTGSLVLIDGRFNAGKSLVSQHIVWGALEAGYGVVLYVTEYGVSSLLREMEHYGMKATDYFLLSRLNIYPVPSDPQRSSRRSFATLGEHFSRLVDSEVVVIDALTTFISGASDEEMLAFFAACRGHCSSGKTVAVTVHSHALSARMLEQLRSICNVHLRLKFAYFQKRVVHVLEVAMVRDAEKRKSNVVSFEVVPGRGFTALPFTTSSSS